MAAAITAKDSLPDLDIQKKKKKGIWMKEITIQVDPLAFPSFLNMDASLLTTSSTTTGPIPKEDLGDERKEITIQVDPLAFPSFLNMEASLLQAVLLTTSSTTTGPIPKEDFGDES
ncbi:hypothetical protein RHGRI_031492 [Rhododendron griersonianum]|uniref:Uncharacterized protein n=1 Tax=Rhododendron griersonianum TaxID=479676 RepID=A0AAV6IDV8_9ERIC|nr:hypothetical protein RHGRI_031492 [Rhododendron griersonianum]